MTATVAYEETGAPITYAEAAELTRDLIDELYPPLTVGELTYGAGRALEAVDPVAFRMAVLDEVDYRIAEGYWTEEEPPADAEAEAYVGLWQGGTGYAVGSWATDAEVFDNLDHARAVFEVRAANVGHLAPTTHAAEWDDNDGTAHRGARLDPMLTPCVDDTATLTLARLDGATLHGIEGEGYYAVDFVIHRDASGATVADPAVVYAG